MLSTTYEITDIKAKLEDYEYYGFNSDAEFVARLTACIEEAMYEDMYPKIGEYADDLEWADYYDTISALDRTYTDLYDTYLYQAECFFAIAHFFEWLGREEKAKRRGLTETITMDGVTNTSTQPLGKFQAAQEWREKAKRALFNAGITITVRLERC